MTSMATTCSTADESLKVAEFSTKSAGQWRPNGVIILAGGETKEMVTLITVWFFGTRMR